MSRVAAILLRSRERCFASGVAGNPENADNRAGLRANSCMTVHRFSMTNILEKPDLSPRELAVNFTDTQVSFVSEATVYRLLKDHGLITSPAFILMKAADRFANPTTAPNQLWQTDF